MVVDGATISRAVWLGSDVMTGMMTSDNVTHATRTPRLFGELVIETASGKRFEGWTVGSEIPLDFTINLYGPPTVNRVWSGISPETYTPIARGEIINTSEPGTLALVGSALLAIGGILRHRARP